jgi:hypothetical protein
MIDLKAIEDRLNNDSAYQEEFLKDPVELFKREGILLGDQHVEQFRKLVQELQSPSQTPVGSNLLGEKVEWRMGIGKNWTF